MSEQETFGEDSTPESASVYYRPIITDERGIPDPEEANISHPSKVEELLEYIKDRKLRYPSKLEDSEMGEVAYSHVTELAKNGPDPDSNVRLLLSSFCDSLQSKQRTKNKYAMLVCYGSDFLLAHVKTKRGMSLQEESGKVELVRRFLDVDNILSAAYFEQQDGQEIQFSHFTDTDSGSFRNFIGVSEKRVNYRRKSIQIICQYEGKTGLECKFEFGNDQFEQRWMQQESLKIKNDRLSLSNGRSHAIKEIRWGRSTYTNPQNFMSEFREYSYNLDGQSRRYNDLKRLPVSGVASAYSDDTEVIDHKSHVVIRDGEGQEEIQEKGELPSHIHVLYANKAISLSTDFASEIFQGLIDTSDVSLYHPSNPFAANEFSINGLSLFNIEEEELAAEREKVLNTIHNHLVNSTGETVRRCLGFVFLHILSDCDCVEVGFKRGLDQVINLNHGTPRQHDVVTTKEHDGTGLIEYKDRADLTQKEDAAESIVDNIEKERKRHDEKVFLWGVDEETRRIDGLRKQRWDDDRVSGIQSHVDKKLEERTVEYNDFELLNLPVGDEREKCIIVGVLY
ncbi:hypothetical protein QA600_15065 [Natronococcus sp. A-GB1]|uniref:hypothetical protein n=1 Tax=Natronococcus sp. A-GB1 TaxID=3037648 RepID=UPI00241E14C9|nr:hypothetical protein [Natronococcus sp. A-GB1]MDG5760655.1 hypothetical protein [Natronococcus sp. A-GB1]